MPTELGNTPLSNQIAIPTDIPTVDDSLTVSGAAADAATVGEAFDLFSDWLTETTYTVTPTITYASGWSASTAITVRIINGRIGYVSGNIKRSSACAAGTSVNPFSAFSWPTGVALLGGAVAMANQQLILYFNNASTAIMPLAQIASNTNIYVRGLIPLTVTSDAYKEF